MGTDDDAPGLTGVNWNYDVQSRLFERDGLCTLTDLIDKHFVLPEEDEERGRSNRRSRRRRSRSNQYNRLIEMVSPLLRPP